ncbi:hypothetical protein IAI18_03775 [Acetobacteraceae bacterium H6797]|nr:hypothetical protein [Acetobacteraceae bacterium H6797]
MITRRASFGLAAPFLLAATGARAAETLVLLTGAPSDSPSDRWARAFAPFIERHLQKMSLRVRNLPGHGGLDAVRRLADAPPDGKMIGSVSVPAFPGQAVEQGVPELLERVDFLAAVAEEPMVLVGSPAVGELGALRQVKEGAIGTPPAGSAGHLLALSLKDELPALTVLPFPTGAAARQAAQAGNVAAAVVSLGEVNVQLKDGKLPGIAMATVQRVSSLPQVPSFTELGLVVPRPVIRGFALPRGTPEALRGPLLAALKATTTDPEFIDQGKASGFRPRFRDSEDWRGVMMASAAELQARWRVAPWRE